MAETAEKAPEKEAPKREPLKEITYTDDKRAQYARLVVANFVRSNAKAYGQKPGEVDVNKIPKSVLEKAAKDIANGNYLNGKEGIEFIQEHSANGSTTGRGLTFSYASEVRPFLRKGILSESFGRRGGLSDEEKAERAKKAEEEKAARAKERDEKKAAREKEAAEKKAAKEKADAEAKAKAEADAKAKEAAKS